MGTDRTSGAWTDSYTIANTDCSFNRVHHAMIPKQNQTIQFGIFLKTRHDGETSNHTQQFSAISLLSDITCTMFMSKISAYTSTGKSMNTSRNWRVSTQQIPKHGSTYQWIQRKNAAVQDTAGRKVQPRVPNVEAQQPQRNMNNIYTNIRWMLPNWIFFKINPFIYLFFMSLLACTTIKCKVKFDQKLLISVFKLFQKLPSATCLWSNYKALISWVCKLRGACISILTFLDKQ